MSRSIAALRRPTPALLLAVVALFVALGGTGYAAAKMSGKDLVKRSVPADRIVLNALTGTQIKESSLGQVPRALAAVSAQNAQAALTAKTAEKALEADKAITATTALDADKLQGRTPAAFMAASVRLVVAVTANVPGPAGGTPASITASCAATERAISGGGGWYIPGTDTQTALQAPVTGSAPTIRPDGQVTAWQVSGRNMAGVDRVLRAHVLCVPAAA